MKLKFFICFLIISGACFGQQNPSWEKVNWLIGKWVGSGQGKPGQGSGTFSFEKELDGNIIVRKSHSEIQKDSTQKAFGHDDLMILYHEGTNYFSKAIYFDNEGHNIQYEISFSQKSMILLSKKSNGTPAFRLTYTLISENTLLTTFEISSDGEKFIKYIEGESKRIQ